MGNFIATPPIVSAHGPAIDKLLWLVHGLMVVLFVGWLVYFVIVLLKFRKTRRATANYAGVKGKFSTYAEVGVAVVEGALLVGLAIPIWVEAVEKFPPEEEAVVIEVMGRQFNWTARYSGLDRQFGDKNPAFVTSADPFGTDKDSEGGADDFVVVNDFFVPVNKPVIVRITAQDVIHSFTIRPMRVMQDAIPGMMIPMHFTPVKTGTYPITCAQLCGLGHYSMRGTLKVVTQEEYDEWIVGKVGVSSGVNLFE